jgi:ABC-type sugar transport system substrate-binding protein
MTETGPTADLTTLISRKTFLAGTTFAGLGLLGFGCGSSSQTASTAAGATKRATGMAHVVLNNTCLESMKNGAWHAWDQLGQATATEAFEGDNPQKCLSQAELMGGRHVGMCVVGLADDGIYNKYMLALTKQKIYAHSMSSMIPWAIPIEPQYQGYHAGQLFGGFADESYQTGRRLFKELGGEGDIIHLKGIPGFAGEAMRTYGFNKALAENPGIRVVAQEYTNWDRIKAADVTRALISAHPNVRAIFGNNDSIGAGAVAALRALRKKNILVTGVDGDPPFVQMIADDDGLAFCTSAARCDLNGMYMAVRAYDRMNGVEYDPLESLIIVDGTMVDTPDAARKLVELVDKPSKPPYDAKLASRHLHPNDWKVPGRIIVLDPYREWSPKSWVQDLKDPPTEVPASVPKEYLDALTPENAAKLNKRYEEANLDFFAPVRELSSYQGPIAYTLPLPEGVAAAYTPPKEWQ